jgi:hypothetical protein
MTAEMYKHEFGMFVSRITVEDSLSHKPIFVKKLIMMIRYDTTTLYI